LKRTEAEIRNSKPEIRKKTEVRSPKGSTWIQQMKKDKEILVPRCFEWNENAAEAVAA
jgi:hypothetical protein